VGHDAVWGGTTILKKRRISFTLTEWREIQQQDRGDEKSAERKRLNLRPEVSAQRANRLERALSFGKSGEKLKKNPCCYEGKKIPAWLISE